MKNYFSLSLSLSLSLSEPDKRLIDLTPKLFSLSLMKRRRTLAHLKGVHSLLWPKFHRSQKRVASGVRPKRWDDLLNAHWTLLIERDLFESLLLAIPRKALLGVHLKASLERIPLVSKEQNVWLDRSRHSEKKDELPSIILKKRNVIFPVSRV